MERYESCCVACGHRWTWVGFKTTMGKTPAQIAEMERAGRTCPRCGGVAKVGLDHDSPEARSLDGALRDVLGTVLGKKTERAKTASPSPRSPSEVSRDPAYEVMTAYEHGNYWPSADDIVVKHKETGTFWRAVYAMRNDDSDYEVPNTSWKQVVPEVRGHHDDTVQLDRRRMTMTNVSNAGAGDGGAGGVSGGSLTLKALAFHEKLWVAYVYDPRGELLRWRMFTHDLDAAAWARKKAEKLARRQPREIGKLDVCPWAVRVYTTGSGA
jgi:hypothetical protein